MMNQWTVVDIVCVGDSVTFGWGVTQDESYPQRLEDILNLNVLNTGVPALKPEHVEAYINRILAECTAEDCIGRDETKLDDAKSPTRICPNDETNPTNAPETKGIQMGVVLPPLASFDQKEEATMLVKSHFSQRTIRCPHSRYNAHL